MWEARRAADRIVRVLGGQGEGRAGCAARLGNSSDGCAAQLGDFLDGRRGSSSDEQRGYSSDGRAGTVLL